MVNEAGSLLTELKRKIDEAPHRDGCVERHSKKLASTGSPTSVDADEFVDRGDCVVMKDEPMMDQALPSLSSVKMEQVPSVPAVKPFLDHHVGLILRESDQQKYLRSLLHKVMGHSKNRNIFNIPVDVEVLQLYNYRTVIKVCLLGCLSIDR